MKCIHEKKYTVGPSDCDHTTRMSIPAAFDVFMDIASEHAESLGIGAGFMMETGMFWLTTKTRVHFYSAPSVMKGVMLATWPHRPRGIQTIRDYRMTTASGRVLAEGKTQWAVLNTVTGALVKIDDVFPKDLDLVEETVLDQPFSRISEDVSDCEEFASYKVRSIDIDLGNHMNNVAYVRALFGAFSSKELDELRINDCEVCYKKSCYEGDNLRFFRRSNGSGYDVIVKGRGDDTVILARLTNQEA